MAEIMFFFVYNHILNYITILHDLFIDKFFFPFSLVLRRNIAYNCHVA